LGGGAGAVCHPSFLLWGRPAGRAPVGVGHLKAPLFLPSNKQHGWDGDWGEKRVRCPLHVKGAGIFKGGSHRYAEGLIRFEWIWFVCSWGEGRQRTHEREKMYDVESRERRERAPNMVAAPKRHFIVRMIG
jgi:hypothetical protein